MLGPGQILKWPIYSRGVTLVCYWSETEIQWKLLLSETSFFLGKYVPCIGLKSVILKTLKINNYLTESNQPLAITLEWQNPCRKGQRISLVILYISLIENIDKNQRGKFYPSFTVHPPQSYSATRQYLVTWEVQRGCEVPPPLQC